MNLDFRAFRKKTAILLIATVASLALIALSSPAATYAQVDAKGNICEATGGNCTGEGAQNEILGIAETVVEVISIAVGVASVIVIVVAALRLVISSGDAQAVAGARNQILYAIIGLAVALSTFGIVNFVMGRF